MTLVTFGRSKINKIVKVSELMVIRLLTNTKAAVRIQRTVKVATVTTIALSRLVRIPRQVLINPIKVGSRIATNSRRVTATGRENLPRVDWMVAE